MATREQVAFRLREYERRESQLNDEGMITLGVLRLALKAIDTERDAALGAKVRAWVASNGGAEYLRQHSMDVSVTSFAVARLCDVIAAHLRAEGGGVMRLDYEAGEVVEVMRNGEWVRARVDLVRGPDEHHRRSRITATPMEGSDRRRWTFFDMAFVRKGGSDAES